MKRKVTISGMHCASCAGNIEKSIRKVPGVISATVSLLMNKGFVESDDSVSDEALSNAVKRAGYKATAVEKA